MYDAQKCATCHSIAGEGNPRNPLDGVASRWEASELRDWITGTGVAVEVLSAAVVKRKRRYESIQEADLNALVTYLLSLAEQQSEAKAQRKRSRLERHNALTTRPRAAQRQPLLLSAVRLWAANFNDLSCGRCGPGR